MHPNANHILGPNNLAFMHGPGHKRLRQSFLHLFSRKALGIYVQNQDRIIRQYLDEWFKTKGIREMRDPIRDLNQDTSQQVFIGPYLDNDEVRAKFSAGYRAMTDAFLAFPLCVPGTKLWQGKQGRLYVMTVLEECTGRALQAMRQGMEPRCLLDFWAQQVLKDMAEADAKGEPHPEYCTTHR